MQRFTKQYPSGRITLDAEQFDPVQETLDGKIHADPVLHKVVERLFEYENEQYGLDTSEFEFDNKNINAVPIEEMNLSFRSYNCLTRAGIKTLRDLSRFTADDLMRVRNLGQKSLKEIIDKCKRYEVEIKEVHNG